MSAMTTEKKLRPEGELIETARERTGLSQNAAAREIGISGTRWRQIVKGTGTAEGVRVAVRGGEATLAKMALLVGVSAEDMDAVGRPDVARKIRGADPLAASTPAWDGELVGGPLMEGGEELRWCDRPGGGRLYQYRTEGFEHQATLDTGTPPEEAVLLLRAQLAKRIHRMSGVLMDRPQKSPREA